MATYFFHTCHHFALVSPVALYSHFILYMYRPLQYFLISWTDLELLGH